MEFVIKESRRPYTWYFCPPATYLCKEGDTLRAKLFGGDIPNPEEIVLKRKIARARLPLNQRGLYRTQPDPITVELWNDWQRRQGLGENETNNQEAEAVS